MDLGALPVIDGHCHPLLPDPWTVSATTLLDILTEARPDTMRAHAAHARLARRTLHDLARYLDTEPAAEAVLKRRRALGPEAARRLVADRRLEALLVDTGYPPQSATLDEMRRLLPCAVHEIFRIEACAERLLADDLPYEKFLARYRDELDHATGRSVALKTIVAYRSGLAVRPWEAGEARAAYGHAVARLKQSGSPRLSDKPLLDTLVLVALEVAAERNRPLQVHAGLGDPDIDLLQANPLLLRPLLEEPRWAGTRLVILHMAYPYAREAAFMAAVWPQVFLDLSLALPLLGAAGVPLLAEVLSLAPATKLLYGSDVRALPELFALAADWGRAALGEALDSLAARGELTAEEARAVARRVLADNARTLYGLAPGSSP